MVEVARLRADAMRILMTGAKGEKFGFEKIKTNFIAGM